MNEELLISLVEKYPELYNQEDPRYHDDQRRMNIWEEIAGIMNETPTACREKWKKIRENFRKANKLRKTKSGQAAKNFKPIRYFKELSFLTPYIHNESKSLSNLAPVLSDDEQNSITSLSSANESPAVSFGTSVSMESASKKKKTGETTPTGMQSLFQSYLEKKYSHNQREEEEPIISFFKNLGQTVMQFPPHLQLRVKRSVFNIVSEAEEEFLRNNTVQLSLPTPRIPQSANEGALPNTSFSHNINTHPATVVLSAPPQSSYSQLTSHDIINAPILLSSQQISTSPPSETSSTQLGEFLNLNVSRK